MRGRTAAGSGDPALQANLTYSRGGRPAASTAAVMTAPRPRGSLVAVGRLKNCSRFTLFPLSVESPWGPRGVSDPRGPVSSNAHSPVRCRA